MKRQLVALVVFLGALAPVRAQQSSATPKISFRVVSRIADADPSVVHEVDVEIPTVLKVARTSDMLSIALYPGSSQTVKLMVGKNMITGVKTALWVYPQGATRPQQPHSVGLSSTLNFQSTADLLHANRGGIPSLGTKYIIEEDLTIFETDVPTQHMWAPQDSPNYKVLWQGAVKQIVNP